jgi:hypothetical protein
MRQLSEAEEVVEALDIPNKPHDGETMIFDFRTWIADMHEQLQQKF